MLVSVGEAGSSRITSPSGSNIHHGSPLTRRFPGILFNHPDLAIYIDRAVATRSLDLSGGHIAEDVGYIVEYMLTKQLMNFQTFNFSSCQLTQEALDGLVRIAIEQGSLETFVVSDNRLPKGSGHALAKLLGGRGIVKVLEASHNLLGDVGIASIAGAFSSDLTSLHLASQGPGVSSIPLLALSRLTLCVLDLSNNGISDLGIETLCKGLRVCSSNVNHLHESMSLRILRLNRNRIGDTGAVALSYLISHGGGNNNGGSDQNEGDGSHGMPSSLLCFSLEELSLADNPIGALGIAALLQASSPTSVHHNQPHPSNGHYHVSQGHPSSSSSSSSLLHSSSSLLHSSKLTYTGASALRRLSLAHTNLSLVSLHDIADYLTSLVRVSVTIEDPSSEPPFELALDFSESRAREIIRETAVTHTTTRSAWEMHQIGVNREQLQHVRSERLAGAGPGLGQGQGRDDVDFTQDLTSQARTQGLTLTAVFLQITEALRANPHVVRCTFGMLPELLRQTTVSMSVAHEDAVREVIIREAGEGADFGVNYSELMTTHSPYSHMLHDLHGALEAMDGVKEVLGLNTELKDWIYDHVIRLRHRVTARHTMKDLVELVHATKGVPDHTNHHHNNNTSSYFRGYTHGSGYVGLVHSPSPRHGADNDRGGIPFTPNTRAVKDAEDMLSAMRSRLYGHGDNNNGNSNSNNNPTTTTTTISNNNNNNNNAIRNTTQIHHTQSVVAVDGDNGEGDEGEEDDDVGSSSFFMTEVTPTKKKAATTAATATAGTATMTVTSNDNHNHHNNRHHDSHEKLAVTEGTGTDVGNTAKGVGASMVSDEHMSSSHSLPPFARHALGQRQHGSTSHTLHQRHPHHPQRPTQSSLSHRENVFSQLDAVPLRYRHDILHDGTPGTTGNTYPRTSPVSLPRPLHGAISLPGGSHVSVPGAGGVGGGGERGGWVDSQKRELDRLRENHTAAFSHLANEIEQLDEISRLDAHLQGLAPGPVARGPGLGTDTPHAPWSAPPQPSNLSPGQGVSYPSTRGPGLGPGLGTHVSSASLPPPPSSHTRGSTRQGWSEPGPGLGLASGQGLGPDILDSSSVSAATGGQHNQNVQALVQQAVNAALDKAQRQWLSALAPVLISMRGKEGGDNSDYGGVEVALGMTDHLNLSDDIYSTDKKGYDHKDKGYHTMDKGYGDPYKGSFEEKTGSTRLSTNDTPSPPPLPTHGYTVPGTTGGYPYPHLAGPSTGQPSSTYTHTHTHHHTPSYTSNPRGYSTGTHPHPHLGYPPYPHPHPHPSSMSTVPVSNPADNPARYPVDPNTATTNGTTNTPYQRIAALESALEQEKEASLQVLDLLLAQQQQQQQQLPYHPQSHSRTPLTRPSSHFPGQYPPHYSDPLPSHPSSSSSSISSSTSRYNRPTRASAARTAALSTSTSRAPSPPSPSSRAFLSSAGRTSIDLDRNQHIINNLTASTSSAPTTRGRSSTSIHSNNPERGKHQGTSTRASSLTRPPPPPSRRPSSGPSHYNNHNHNNHNNNKNLVSSSIHVTPQQHHQHQQRSHSAGRVPSSSSSSSSRGGRSGVSNNTVPPPLPYQSMQMMMQMQQQTAMMNQQPYHHRTSQTHTNTNTPSRASRIAQEKDLSPPSQRYLRQNRYFFDS